MKRLFAKAVALTLSAALSLSVLAASFVTAGAAPEYVKSDIVSAFNNPDLDAKPMARMWFVDGQAGEIDDDMIEEHLTTMAEGGFGGVEIALLADNSNMSNSDAAEYGWGTENWKKTMKKILAAADSIEGGFKVDFTISPHWPPIVNTIDPNDDEAATEMSYAYTKITADDLAQGTVDLPLPTQKKTDLARAPFYMTDRFVAARVAQIVGFEEETNKPIFEFTTLQDASGATSKKTAGEGESYKEEDGVKYAGYAAGIPSREVAEANGIDYDTQIVAKFGPDPATNDFEGKIDADGNRKRMADWQYLYQTDLSALDLAGYAPDNDETFKVGDYVLFGTYCRGTGQAVANANTTTKNRTYVTNYFDERGIQKVLDFWNENILDDELRAMMAKNGGSIFEDSIETTHDGPFWSADLMEDMSGYLGYDATLYAPVYMSARTSKQFVDVPGQAAPDIIITRDADFIFTSEDDESERIIEDYNLALAHLFETQHAQTISDWADGFNYDYRAQAYSLPGLSIVGGALATDVTEGDNSTYKDALRQLASAVNMKGEKLLSLESCTFAKMDSNWQTFLKEMNQNTSHGVNRVIVHGSAYPVTLNDYQDSWPGWNWGGGSGFPAWDGRQIYWNDVNSLTGYITRTQAVMQNGAAKVDLAILNDTEESFNLITRNSNQALLDAGYSYNILDESVLGLDSAVVTNGVLNENGPAYKAIILDDVSMLSALTAEKLIGYAEAGLPVILKNSDPNRIYGTEKGEDTVANLVAAMDTLKGLDNVKSVSTDEELFAALASLGLTSSARYASTSGLEASHRQDSVGDYYYLFNDNSDAAIKTQVTLEGSGVPYQLDAWTGEIIPIAEYEAGNGSVTINLELDAKNAVIIAVAPAGGEFPAVQDKHAVSSSGGNVTTCGGAVTHQASEAGSYSVKLSDGTTANINIESVKPSVSLTSFDLSLESWGPDEAVNDVNPTISKKTTLNFTDSTLCAWNELPVTQEQLSDLGVASMADVSGIGRYTTTFTLPENWSAQDGATLNFSVHENDMLVAVTVNGTTFDCIDTFATTLDLGHCLKAGENTITIQIDSTLTNRFNATHSSADRTEHGLISASIVPYVETAVVTADKGILASVIAYAESDAVQAELAGAIESVQTSFTASLASAKEVYSNAGASQSEVDSAWISLMSEIHKLGFQAGDKTSLNALIGYADSLQMDLYVDGSAKDAFGAALAAAKETAADGDALAGDIEQAQQDLIDALLALRYKADKSVLEQVLDQANAIDTSAYTAASVESFNRAKAAAEELFNNPALSQDDQADVDRAADNLRTAILSLDLTVSVAGDSSVTVSGSTPKTGDVTPFAAAVTLMALAGAGILINRKKK